MNAKASTASDRDNLLGTFVAELATAAYAVALRHGTGHSWVDLQLELWKALNETVRNWGQRCPPEENPSPGSQAGPEPAFRRRRTKAISQTIQEKNKALVLEAFNTLFNRRDYAAAERLWSPNYVQHSAHIAPGREGLFNLIKSMPQTLRYEPGVIMAVSDFVIIYGRFSGFGTPVNWIAASVLRIGDGILLEHWDIIQDEATEE